MKIKNARADQIKLSYIRNVMERAKALESQGRSIVHLELGEPDFKTPEPLIEATVKALRDGDTHYGPDEGIDELRQLVAEKFATEKGLQVDPLNNVIITAGASEALFDAILGLTGPGRSVLIPEPAFGNYYNCCLCAGSRPVNVPLRLTDRCRLDFTKLQEAVDGSTGFLLLNNPHNPTGGLFAPDQIQQLAEFATQNDLVVITDEIYENIYYGDTKPLSIASIPGMQERTVMIGGFSKTYAMTGWRVGYVVAPTPLYEPIQKIHQYSVTCVSTFSQTGIVNGLKQSDEAARLMAEEFNKRRRYLTGKLDEMEGLSYLKPEGAFYLFINITKFNLSSMDFSRRLLDEHGVATIPGSTFGPSGEGFIRISYAASMADIAKGVASLKTFLSKLN